jgi:DNA repair exonuclease SbcCD ATPase subunit
MVREEDIRTAFSKVRDDINDVKRSINKNIFRVDDLTNVVAQLTTKEEFYAFIAKLNAKLDQYEKSFAEKREMDKFVLVIKERVDYLKSFVDKREHLIDQIREIQKVKGKMAELQADAASKSKLREEIQEIDAQLSEIRKHLSDGTSLKKYDDDLRQFRDTVASVAKDAVSWKELQKESKSLDAKLAEHRNEMSAVKQAIAKIESTAEKIHPVHDELDEVKAIASRLDSDFKHLHEDMVQKDAYDGKIKEMKSEISALSSKIEGSLVETDMNDYASKEQLKAISKRIQTDFASAAAFNELKQSVKSLGQYETDIIKSKEELQKLRKETESLQKQIIPEAEIEDLSEDLKALSIEVAQLREERKGLKEPKAPAADELKKLKDEISRVMLDVEESSEEARQLSKEISQLKEGRKEFAKEAKTYAAGDDLKKLKDDVSYIMSNMAGSNELKQQEKDFSSEITALRNEIKELKKETKSSIADVKTEVKKEAKEKQGIIAKMSKATTEFFTEEDESPKKEEQDEGKGWLLIIGIIAILIVVAGISFYMAGQNRAGIGTITTTTPTENATVNEQAIENQTHEAVTEPVSNITSPVENLTAGNITQPESNITVPENISMPAENITAQENISEPIVNATVPENITPVDNTSILIPIENITGHEPVNITEMTQEQLEENCTKAFECKKADGGFFYDCYYDNLTKDCRCYTGSTAKCKVTEPTELVVNNTQVPAASKPWYENVKYRYALLFVIAAIILVLILLSMRKEGKEEGGKKKKPKKEEERPDKKPIDEDVIDLKEFFEEK